MTTKYITQNGVRKLNPDWKAESQSFPFGNRSTALPIVSYPSQKGLFANEEEIVVTPSYTQAVEQYNDIMVEAEIVVDGEDNHHGGLGKLAEVLGKYEIPGGMLGKLLGLKNFDVAEIIVDDSGSMMAYTDALGPNGERITRWNEAKMRILQMMEIIAYVTAPTTHIRFLNRSAILQVERRAGESPETFIERISQMVENEFLDCPRGLTPALECIRDSLGRHRGMKCLRYFMGDGVPNGGDQACQQIRQLLVSREYPENNPFTFMSCTDQDAATEWMKECEEVALFCSEFDDYRDESREILKDQGKAFPYSYGLHLVAQIVAAFNPDDLDAMDESVPFAKQTLDDLLGYQTSVAEYKYYFDSFLEAQKHLPLQPNQKTFVATLPGLFSEFLEASRAATISAVAEYRRQTKAMTRQLKPQQAPVAEAECCVIL